jgi:hypothetical protein
MSCLTFIAVLPVIVKAARPISSRANQISGLRVGRVGAVELRSICGIATQKTLNPHSAPRQGGTSISIQAIVFIAEIYLPPDQPEGSERDYFCLFCDLGHICNSQTFV